MIRIPRLNTKQAGMLEDMRETDGWQLVRRAIEQSIKIKDSELLAWRFQYDDNGHVSQKQVLRYREEQMENEIMKKLLDFIENPLTIQESQDE